MRILHALTGAAGQPWTATRALRGLGHHADALRVGESRYGFKADLEFSVSRSSDYSEILRTVADDYDVFHFYFRSFYFASGSLAFPTGLDMVALRAAGKVVIMNFRGSEIRLHSVFQEASPWSYVDENPGGLTTKFPESVQRRYLAFCRGVANRLIVGDPELATYVPGATIVPRSIDLEQWKPVGPVDSVEPLVVHAPSRRGVKGTQHVLDAVASLKARGFRFRFELVEGLAQEEARELYRRADIVVDQLRIGWYGVLAVEAMALGKPVVVYIREDLRHHLETMAGGTAPVAYADPVTVEEVLGSLIDSSQLREQLGVRGRGFCEAVHDSTSVARRQLAVYEQEMDLPTPVDVGEVITLLDAQHKRIRKGHLRRRRGLTRYPTAFLAKVREEGVAAALRRTWQVVARRPSMERPAVDGVGQHPERGQHRGDE